MGGRLTFAEQFASGLLRARFHQHWFAELFDRGICGCWLILQLLWPLPKRLCGKDVPRNDLQPRAKRLGFRVGLSKRRPVSRFQAIRPIENVQPKPSVLLQSQD